MASRIRKAVILVPGVRSILAARWQRRYDSEFIASLEAARKRGDFDEVRNLESNRQASEYFEYQDSEIAFTEDLVRKAAALRVPLPPHPLWSEDGSENEFWKYSCSHGQRYLSSSGVATLRDSIRREREARRNARNHLIAWIGALTGLVGALTGLAAVVNK